MKIAIIGAGSIAQALAKPWVAAGHQVMLSSRNPENLEPLTTSLGVSTGTVAATARFGEVLLLAVNYGTVAAAINEMAPLVSGKLIIDATNPLVWNAAGQTERVIGEDQIAGLVMQEKLPQARIGKAFTTVPAQALRSGAGSASPLGIPFAADQDPDRQTLAGLIGDAGFAGVALGTLAQSRPLDPPSPIWGMALAPEEIRQRLASSSGPKQ